MKNIGRVLRHAAPLYVASLAEAHRPSAITIINGATTVADNYVEELRATSEDATLTPQGRALRRQKAKASALAALAAVEEAAKTKQLTERADAIDKALLAKAVPAVPKDAATEMQLRDIQSQLRGLSADERLSLYRTTTDPLVLAAIETAAPTLNDQRKRFEPFVDPAEVAIAQRQRAEAIDPAAATTLRELRDLADVHRRAVNLVRHDIESAAS